MSAVINALPSGWTVTEYPSTIDIHDETGRVRSTVPKPYERGTTLGELIALGMSKIDVDKAPETALR